MENSFFGTLLLRFWILMKQSMLAQLLGKLYTGIQNFWQGSGTYRILFDAPFKLNIQDSRVYKIIASPFTLLNVVGEKRWFACVQKSRVLGWIKQYLMYIMHLNTRFFGGFMLGFAIFYVATTKQMNYYGVIAAVIGFVGIILNMDGTILIKESYIVRWVLNWLDLEVATPPEKIDERYSILYGCIIGGITGILMFWLSPIKALLMLIGLTVVAFMFYKPIYGLYLTVFIAPILPTKIMLVVCAVVAASVVVRNLVDSTHKWHLDDVGFLLIALLIMYGIGVIVSFTPMSSLAVWFVYMIFIGFYVIMMQLLEDKRTIFTLIKVFVISGTLVAVYGILQYVFGWGVNENWIDPNVFSITKRAYSTLENPNILGEYLILTVLAGTGLMVTRKTWMARIGYAGCTGLMIICLMATFSRGCWLGVGFAIAVFITFYNGKLWAASIPLLLVAPLVLPDSVIHRFTSIGNMEDTSTAIRVKIWLSSLGMGTDFMLTGLGLGTAAYAFVYPFYAYYYIPAHHSHNAFFQVLIEGGIIGLILFIGIIWRFVKHMTLTYKRELTKDKTVSFMVLALAAGVGGFFIQGMFDYSFYNYRMVLIFWLFVAMGTALAKVSQKEMHQ